MSCVQNHRPQSYSLDSWEHVLPPCKQTLDIFSSNWFGNIPRDEASIYKLKNMFEKDRGKEVAQPNATIQRAFYTGSTLDRLAI